MPNKSPTYLFAGALLVLPFVFSSRTMDPTLLPRFLVLSLVILVLVLLGVRRPSLYLRGDRQVVHRLMIVASSGYFLFVVLSVFIAPNFAEAAFETLKVGLWLILIYVATIILSGEATAIKLICRLLTISTSALAVIGLGQYYDVAFGSLIPGALMVSHNLLASVLCLMFPLVMFVVIRDSRWWRIVATVVAALLVAMITLSNTRAAWVAMAAALIISLVFCLVLTGRMRLSSKHRSTNRRRIWRTAVLLVVVVLFFGSPYARPGSTSGALTRISTISSPTSGTAGLRVKLWVKSLAIFVDRPLLGVGPGNWKLAVLAQGMTDMPFYEGNLFYQRPHNDHLGILTESGIIAYGSYLLLFALAFYFCGRVYRRSRDNDLVVLAALMVFGLTAFLTASSFSYPKERIVHSTLVALMLAVSLAIHGRCYPQGLRLSRKIIRSAGVGIMLWLICSLVVGWSRFQSETHVKQALAAREAGDLLTVIGEIDRARSVFVQLDHTATPLVWHRGAANYLLGRFDRADADFREAYRLSPHHLHVLNSLAASEELRGNHEQAIVHYREVLRLWPPMIETQLNLTAVYYNLGRYEEALDVLLEIDQQTTDSRYLEYQQLIDLALRKSDDD